MLAAEMVRARRDVEAAAKAPPAIQAAKAAAGRAHRRVSDTALQVFGAIGLTSEHDLHRYVRRGFQLDSLFGSYHELETLVAGKLFDAHAPGPALPAIIACG